MNLDTVQQEITAVTVEVTNPETPFGGVQIFGATDAPIQIVFGPSPESPTPDSAEIPATTNLLAGDGSGGVLDSGVNQTTLVLRHTDFPTPTTLNTVIACLQNAGLCA